MPPRRRHLPLFLSLALAGPLGGAHLPSASASAPTCWPVGGLSLPSAWGQGTVAEALAITCQGDATGAFCRLDWTATVRQDDTAPGDFERQLFWPFEPVGPDAVSLLPGESAVLAASARVRLDSGRSRFPFGFDADELRHLLFAPRWTDSFVHLNLLLESGRTVSLTLEVPPDWKAVGRGHPEPYCDEHAPLEAGPLDPAAVSSSSGWSLTGQAGFGRTWRVPERSPRVIGPAAALLIPVSDDADEPLGFHAGVDLGFTHWLWLETALEAQSEQLRVIPSIQAGSPGMYPFFVLSVIGGVGVPVRVTAPADVGARLLFGAAFGPVTALVYFDFWAGLGDDPGDPRPGLILGLSL